MTVRPAGGADADLLLGWANDPATRAASFHVRPIDPDEHRVWLAGRLTSPTTRLMIGLRDGKPIGQVRLEVGRDRTAEVGISVAPEDRGRGLGRRLLAAAIEAGSADHELAFDRFVARVRVENTASVRLFEAVGFAVRQHGRCDGSPCIVLERAR